MNTQKMGAKARAIAVARALVVCGGAVTLLLASAVHAQSMPYDQMPTVIPADPAMRGYTVDNNPRRYKVHKELPTRVSLRIAGDIDERYKLATLIADEQASYENLRVKKIVIVDSLTGEVKPSPYAGKIDCFANSNLALYVDPGRDAVKSFQYGKYGSALQVWEGSLFPPAERHLNTLSCTLEAMPTRKLKDGTPLSARHDLLPEHGQIGVIEGEPRLANASDLSADAKALMQQPFTRNMNVSASAEFWVLMKPNGDEIAIPNNPGEYLCCGSRGMEYVPYLGAYFTMPATRQMLPPSALARPAFGRLIFPDGRVELFGMPDLIRGPRSVGNIYVDKVLYTKAGLVWKIVFHRFEAGRTRYRGDLEEGYYLQQTATKQLTKLPDLGQEMSPRDGCTLLLKRALEQFNPWPLFNTSHINICTAD